MKKIKLIVIGLGNCASSLLQGINYYKEIGENDKPIPGLMHNVMDGYKIGDIEIVGAFDVNPNKINKPINEAVWEHPNCTKKFSDINSNIIVQSAPILDGLSPRMLNELNIKKSEFDYLLMKQTPWEQLEQLAPVIEWKEKISKIITEMNADVLISYLPVGSGHASRFWTQMCIDKKIGFVNAIPEFICSSKKWINKFENANIVCAGDDIKSQVGATIVHRVLANLIDDRGQMIDNTYQLNFGGNTDFMNMLDEDRLHSKRKSKTQAVTSIISEKNKNLKVKIGPSDYVEYLKDNKLCYINIKGRQFGNVPFEIELKLNVEDSPNSAGVMVDAIRGVKIAMDRGMKGNLDEISSYCFKSPRIQYTDDIAKNMVEKFINKKNI